MSKIALYLLIVTDMSPEWGSREEGLISEEQGTEQAMPTRQQVDNLLGPGNRRQTGTGPGRAGVFVC